MKLLIYEYITSGALAAQSLTSSLLKEGDAMLLAALKDCYHLPDCQLTILRDTRLPECAITDNTVKLRTHAITTIEQHDQRWQQCLNETDSVLIIAPETDGILAYLQSQVELKGKINLGSKADAIRLCSDKLACDSALSKQNLAITNGCLAHQWQSHAFESGSGYLIKPNDGAGCLQTKFFESRWSLESYLATLTRKEQSQHLIQPYVDGLNISILLLFSETEFIVLAINEQLIKKENNDLHYLGSKVNSIPAHIYSIQQASLLAETVQNVIPGLWGFVGIDIILTKNGPIIIDINPRLTSSYIGLAESLNCNPMLLLFNMKYPGMVALPAIEQRQAITVTK